MADNVRIVPPLPALTTWLRDRPLAADTLMAVAFCGVTLLFVQIGPVEFWPTSWWLFTALAPIGVVPIAVRRRWLWPAVIATTALCALPILDLDLWSTQSATLILLGYTAAAYLSLGQAIAATLLMWAPAMVVAVLAREHVPYSGGLAYTLITNAVFGLVIFLIGRTVHTRRAYAVALEERAYAAESNQIALASQAVADERRRIARELHDVVAHHVSVMGVLASGARRTGQRDPKAAQAALATIEETGRSAMRELRRLLDVLRTDEEPADLTPQPGLTAVRQLIDQLRDTGLQVTAHLNPGPDDLDPGLALAVYRIVQEALTNTIKHAGPARAVVRLRCTADRLTIEVTDDGRGPALAPGGVGHGLVGMRERVLLYGGELSIGPRTGGGFRVYATLPVERSTEITAGREMSA